MTQQDDEFLALQDEVSLLYHRGPKPEPSAQLDELILAKAHAQLNANSASNQAAEQQQKVVQISIWQKYRWQLSSAASVLMIAGLFLMIPMDQHIDPAPRDIMPQPMSATNPEMQLMSAESNHAEAINEAQENLSAEPAQLSDEVSPRIIESRAMKSAAKLAPKDIANQAPIIADVDSALLQLNALITRGEWQQSMALLADIEQRFPEVTQPQSNHYSQYSELKQRLSTR